MKNSTPLLSICGELGVGTFKEKSRMNFTIHILGTASALPTSSRYPSAQIVDVRGRLFMIDCGEGAQMQIRKAGISFQKIEHICLSHIHGDHIFGIFGLLSTMGLLGY